MGIDPELLQGMWNSDLRPDHSENRSEAPMAVDANMLGMGRGDFTEYSSYGYNYGYTGAPAMTFGAVIIPNCSPIERHNSTS